MPPEILGLDGEEPKSANAYLVDLWCPGETVYQTLAGRGTFENIGKLVGYVKGAVDFPNTVLKEAGVSDDGVGFIRSLMSPFPSQRLSTKQALNHPWMLDGEEERLDVDDGLSRTHSGLDRLNLEAIDVANQASGEWTRERVTKAGGDSDRTRNLTPTSIKTTDDPKQPSLDSTTRHIPSLQTSISSKGEVSQAYTISTSMADSRSQVIDALNDKSFVNIDTNRHTSSIEVNVGTMSPGDVEEAACYLARNASENLEISDTTLPDIAEMNFRMQLGMEDSLSTKEATTTLGKVSFEGPEDTSKLRCLHKSRLHPPYPSAPKTTTCTHDVS